MVRTIRVASYGSNSTAVHSFYFLTPFPISSSEDIIYSCLNGLVVSFLPWGWGKTVPPPFSHTGINLEAACLAWPTQEGIVCLCLLVSAQPFIQTAKWPPRLFSHARNPFFLAAPSLLLGFFPLLFCEEGAFVEPKDQAIRIWGVSQLFAQWTTRPIIRAPFTKQGPLNYSGRLYSSGSDVV